MQNPKHKKKSAPREPAQKTKGVEADPLDQPKQKKLKASKKPDRKERRAWVNEEPIVEEKAAESATQEDFLIMIDEELEASKKEETQEKLPKENPAQPETTPKTTKKRKIIPPVGADRIWKDLSTEERRHRIGAGFGKMYSDKDDEYLRNLRQEQVPELHDAWLDVS